MSSGGCKIPPPAPPLPPSRKTITASSNQAVETPPIYLDSLASTSADHITRPLERPPTNKPYKPIYYFFYGTLTQPKVLAHILDLQHPPVLRPAEVIDYALTNWGQYNALVDDKPGQQVTGYAYMLQSVDDELKLARYETKAYEAAPCRIRFTDSQDP